jgi:hypothetical protein
MVHYRRLVALALASLEADAAATQTPPLGIARHRGRPAANVRTGGGGYIIIP